MSAFSKLKYSSLYETMTSNNHRPSLFEMRRPNGVINNVTNDEFSVVWFCLGGYRAMCSMLHYVCFYVIIPTGNSSQFTIFVASVSAWSNSIGTSWQSQESKPNRLVDNAVMQHDGPVMDQDLLQWDETYGKWELEMDLYNGNLNALVYITVSLSGSIHCINYLFENCLFDRSDECLSDCINCLFDRSDEWLVSELESMPRRYLGCCYQVTSGHTSKQVLHFSIRSSAARCLTLS